MTKKYCSKQQGFQLEIQKAFWLNSVQNCLITASVGLIGACQAAGYGLGSQVMARGAAYGCVALQKYWRYAHVKMMYQALYQSLQV